MHQAIDSGWYCTEGGGEVFIQKGDVRADNHPDVKAVPALFKKTSTDAPAAAPKNKKASA